MTDRDMLEEMFEEAEIRYGKRPTAEEYAQNFSLHDAEARINLLKRLDNDTPLNLRAAAERHDYVGKMRRVHERLRKIGK
jgi:hypothetical protein